MRSNRRKMHLRSLSALSGAPDPGEDFCPWNFYRSSGDVRASYASVLAHASVESLQLVGREGVVQ